MLLAATNSGTLIIALPDLERSLHASLLALVWVILALPDRGDGAGADGGPPLGPVRAQEGVHRRFRRLRAGLAGRRLLLGRDGADRVARAAGHRLGVPVRERGGARDRRVPARGAGPGDGHEHDGRGDRPGDRPGAGRRAGRDLVALGLLVQRPVQPRGGGVGRADPARAGQTGRGARLRRARQRDLHPRPHRPRARRLARGL